MTKIKIYIASLLIAVLLATPNRLQAQGRRFAVLDLPGSAVSLAHGGSTFSYADGGNIYANPSWNTECSMRENVVSYSLGWINQKSSKPTFHTLTAAHRQQNSMIMLGARYYAQGTLNNLLDDNMQPVEGSIHMYSYTIDLGYAHKFHHFSIYTTLGLASEKTVTQTNSYRIGLGASYANHYKKATYQIGIGLRDLGIVSTHNANKSLSPLIHAGGAIALQVNQNHNIAVNVDGGLYPTVEYAKQTSTLAGGIDYQLYHHYTIRIGGHIGDDDNYLAPGLGLSFGKINVDGTIKLTLEDDGVNYGMIGINYNF